MMLAFVHPGILSTEADFDRMATKVAANQEPWLSGWNKLLSHGWTHLGMQPGPVETIVRGETNNSYIIWSQAAQMTNLALIWKVTGDTRYADLAVEFLNAWSSVHKYVHGNTNVALALGLYGFEMANVAEIMRDYSGWAEADQAQYKDYLLNVWVDGIHNYLGLPPYTQHWGTDPSHYWANWDLANIGALMAIGVFTDRQDLYDEALNYVYNGLGNGAFDKAIYYMHAGNLGQGQEAGRDQGHATLDFALLGQICQMAWNQGDDLFSYGNNRVLAGVEHLAKYNLGNGVPYVTYQSHTAMGQGQTQIAGPQGFFRPSFEVFYNHYVNIKGLSAPYTTQAVMERTRPEGDYGNGDHYSWGTLLFALEPNTAVYPPQSLVGYQKGTGNIELSWWGGANTTSFTVYRATNTAGPFTQIASGISPNFTSYTDQNLPAGTYYYKVTGVSGTTETAATNVVQATSGAPMISQLNFNESTGTTASDSVGSLTGTLNGGATWAAGKSGNAVSLDGANDYVSLPSGAIKDVADFTISTWVYLNASQTWARIFDFGDSRGDWMFLTSRNGAGNMEFATGTTYNWNKRIVNAPALATNQWVHVAVTFSNRLATIYVNGVAAGSNANMDFPPYQINGGMPNSWLGRSQYTADPYLNGKIDDFRVYNGALSAGDVYTLATGIPAPATPAAPAMLTAAAVPGNAVNLNWSAVSGATSYSIHRATSSSGPFVPIATLVSGTSYSDTAVPANIATGTPYYYLVTAANNGGESAASPQASVTALPPIPATPVTLSAVSNSPTSILLNWGAATNAASYTIKRSLTAGGPYTTVASGLTTTSYTDSGLTSGTTYYYVVSSINAAGESANSSEASDTASDRRLRLTFHESAGTSAQDVTDNGWNGTLVNGTLWAAGKMGSGLDLDGTDDHVTLPAGVVNRLTNVTLSSWINIDALANWQRIFDFGTGTTNYMFLTTQYAGSSNRLRFAIRTPSVPEQTIDSTVATPLGSWVHVAVVLDGGTGTLYLNGVQRGQKTGMTLNPSSLGDTTLNYLGKSQWNDPYFNGKIDDFRIYTRALSGAEVSALATTTLPAAPPNLTATGVGNDQVNLSWSAVAGATGYTILRATSSDGPYTIIASRLSSTSYQDMGLAPDLASGTTYYYFVQAENAAGEGPKSPQASAQLLPPPPASPATLNVQPTHSGTLWLSWDVAAYAGSYTLARATSPSGPYTTVATGITATNYTDAGLTNGMTYYYTVTSVNASGIGDNSPGSSATPTDQWLRLKLDETSGTTASDSTGHNFSGTLTNGPTWTASGKLGRALSFDGSNDYVALPTGAVNGLTSATFSAWVYLNSVTTNSRIFDFGSGNVSGTTGSYMFLTPRGTSAVRFAITIAGYGSEQSIVGNAALPSGAWTHVAVVLNGDTGTLYVNGTQVGQNTGMTLTPSSLGNSTQNWLGRSQYPPDPYLNGRIDDFRIYSRPLSGVEVSSLATLSAPAKPAGVTATAGNAQVSLSWSAVSAAASYSVQRSMTNGGPYTTIAAGLTGTSYLDSQVTNGTTYYYVVTAVNVVDYSVASNQVSATPALPPASVISASHNYLVSPNTLSFVFDADVAGRFSASSLSIDTDPGTGSFSATGFSYNAASKTASFTLPASLADANYRATLAASGVLSGDYSFDFFFLAGDANHDRTVNISDLGILASNWQGSGKTFAEADFNYDGVVNISDLGILASNWQETLAAPGAPMALGGTDDFNRDPFPPRRLRPSSLWLAAGSIAATPNLFSSHESIASQNNDLAHEDGTSRERFLLAVNS